MQQKLLKDTADDEFAIHISKQIIDAAADDKFPVYDNTLTDLVKIKIPAWSWSPRISGGVI